MQLSMMVQVIHLTHWVVLLFVLLAWMSPWPALLWLHVVFVPGMIIHWRTNNNRCVLTELEEKYKVRAGTIAIEDEEAQFVRSIWLRAVGSEPSERLLKALYYGLPALAWLLSVSRLALKA